MTLTIELDDELSKRLIDKASADGVSPQEYASDILRLQTSDNPSLEALRQIWRRSDREGWGRNAEPGPVVCTDDEMYLR